MPKKLSQRAVLINPLMTCADPALAADKAFRDAVCHRRPAADYRLGSGDRSRPGRPKDANVALLLRRPLRLWHSECWDSTRRQWRSKFGTLQEHLAFTMPHRRILSLWFPRLAAERHLRMQRGTYDGPFAVVSEIGNLQTLAALSSAASARGLTRGQPLRDARAMCPDLLTRLADPPAEAQFLGALRRWAGKFSPWVSEEAPDGLVVDLTGCAHLFGGEAALVAQVEVDCADLGLSVRIGLADTVGAARALARYAGQTAAATRSGDAIDQEARATRSRAAKRRNWERGGAAPQVSTSLPEVARIARAGQTRQALDALPVAALRLDDEVVASLNRVGLRRIGEMAGMPRAALARRFGRDVVRRLDQALGVEPEPVSPARPPKHFAVRLTLPDPIGLEEDVAAALDRMLPVLTTRLTEKGEGARRLRLQAFRTDQASVSVEVGLARPSADPARIRPLLVMKLGEIDAGFGIDMLRLEAHVTEPVHATTHRGHLEAAQAAENRLVANTALDDLIGRLGARIGLEAVTRRHPAESHIPEKTAKVMAAAWSEHAEAWPSAAVARPLVLWRPEPVAAEARPLLPRQFRWRRQDLEVVAAAGPERIAPEWWLEMPDWQNGVRDYWRVTCTGGDRLWLYYAHGGALSPGWFCHGRFA